MIKEDTNCLFEDTFLVEPERAIDRVQLWLRNFTSLRHPCADLEKGLLDNDVDVVSAPQPQYHLQNPFTHTESAYHPLLPAASNTLRKQTFTVPKDLFHIIAPEIHAIDAAIPATIVAERPVLDADTETVVVSVSGAEEDVQAALAVLASLLGT